MGTNNTNPIDSKVDDIKHAVEAARHSGVAISLNHQGGVICVMAIQGNIDNIINLKSSDASVRLSALLHSIYAITPVEAAMRSVS